MIVVRRPIITEKSMKLARVGQYTFEVNKEATKPQVAWSIKDKFGVTVKKVWMVSIPGETKTQRRVRKSYQTKGFKKAVVEVEKGQTIPIFETPKEGEEVVVTSPEGEPVTLKERKGILSKTKVKVEKVTSTRPTTQRKVITGK